MNERFSGIMIGAILTIAIISVVGFVTAHSAQTTAPQEQHEEEGEFHCPMHDSMMKWMPCTGLSAEEMDEDNDGICDFCGMPAEECSEMMGSNGFQGMGMHSMMRGMMH